MVLTGKVIREMWDLTGQTITVDITEKNHNFDVFRNRFHKGDRVVVRRLSKGER